MPTLETIAQAYDVAMIYAFGSRQDAVDGPGEGNRDPLADLDLGVVFRHGLPDVRNRARVYAELWVALSDLYPHFPLDLVFLEETHAVFQGEVLAGRLLYSADEAFQSDYEDRILARACDFRPFLERYLEERFESLQ